MKFYDKAGNIHKTFLGSVLSDVLDYLSKPSVNEDDVEFAPFKGYNTPVVPGTVVTPDEDPIILPEDPGMEAEIVTDNPMQYSKISIDYAHGRMLLEDAEGNVITSTPIDGRLTRCTTDKMLIDVLYPDGNVPDEIRTDIESKREQIMEQPVEEIQPAASYTCQCGNIRRPYSSDEMCPICGTQVIQPSDIPVAGDNACG